MKNKRVLRFLEEKKANKQKANMSVEEEVFKIQKKMSKMTGDDGTVSINKPMAAVVLVNN